MKDEVTREITKLVAVLKILLVEVVGEASRGDSYGQGGDEYYRGVDGHGLICFASLFLTFFIKKLDNFLSTTFITQF